MPFKSKAQAGYMHAAMERGEVKPSVVKDFDESSSGKVSGLPDHVKKLAHGGYACLHCGGEVGDDGMFGGKEDDGDEDNTPQGDELDEQTHRALFSMALKRRKS